MPATPHHPAAAKLRRLYAGLAIAVFLLECMVATMFAPIHFIRGSMSDYLVVILIYFGIRTFYLARPWRLATGVFLFAAMIEIGQYYHLADRLGTAHRGLIRLLLGNVFSLQDILMYLLGSVSALLLDTFILRRCAQASATEQR